MSVSPDDADRVLVEVVRASKEERTIDFKIIKRL